MQRVRFTMNDRRRDYGRNQQVAFAMKRTLTQNKISEN